MMLASICNSVDFSAKGVDYQQDLLIKKIVALAFWFYNGAQTPLAEPENLAESDKNTG